eukprot:TRINITY_DN18486_c0_g1_i1.p3 TRINITY_DN18486_c0_g1~~TRINITY_DN18486_c0_g1_i1.p3  ORF type:complete len:105 (-),score=25.57 TRINITY_DN18486_c0_g1_i1:303-617(-)
MAALAGCEQATATFVARRMRIQIGEVRFDLNAVRDERGALGMPIEAEELPAVSRLARISGTAHVETEASQEEVDRLGAQVERRCPVANMVHLSGCELAVRWIKA